LHRSEQERTEQDRLARERKTEEQKRADERLAEQRKAAQALADKQRRDSYLLSRSLPGKVDFVVSAASAAKVPMDRFAAGIAKHLKGRGKTASNTVFSPEFVTGGAFDSFFGGRGGADLQSMPVSNMGSKILLARISINSVRPGTTAAGLFSASVVVAFSVLSSNDGSVADRFEIQAVGPGTSEADATSAALDRVLDQLSQHRY